MRRLLWLTIALLGTSTLAGCAATGCHPMISDTGYRYSRLTCVAPTTRSDRTVTVMLADMGMSRMMGGTAPLGARMMLRALPATVTSGPVTLLAKNMGWRTHELLLLPLADGSSPGQRRPGPDGAIDETTSLGEASASCAGGTGDGVAAGTVGWVSLDLPPGRYELVCNLPNHYANGMYQELDVLG